VTPPLLTMPPVARRPPLLAEPPVLTVPPLLAATTPPAAPPDPLTGLLLDVSHPTSMNVAKLPRTQTGLMTHECFIESPPLEMKIPSTYADILLGREERQFDHTIVVDDAGLRLVRSAGIFLLGGKRALFVIDSTFSPPLLETAG
jgi:hypothetical protein